MRLLWQAPSRLVAWWWALLCLVGIVNIALWLALYRLQTVDSGGTSSLSANVMLGLCAAYVFGCAFRSFLPRADVQRYCLFDTWLSSIAVGRSVATIAEISFAAQCAIMLDHLARVAGIDAVSHIALVIVPLIVVAQCCSWYGVLTTNCLANAIENSIWAVTFLCIGIGLYLLMPAFDGAVKAALAAALIGILGYVAFLVVIDVPMYLSRWRADTAERKSTLTLQQGFRDVATRRLVTHDLAHWKDEMPWMSLYFSAAVWASLVLCLGYSLREHIPNYRIDHTAQVHRVSGQR